MKNTTILLIILLIVSVALYNKKKENMIGDSAKKNELITEIDRKIQTSDNDFKVFNDETTNMANQQTAYFYVLSVVTGVVVLATGYYVVSK